MKSQPNCITMRTARSGLRAYFTGEYPLESLVKALDKHQFGIFVLTPDDEVVKLNASRNIWRLATT